MFLAANEMSYSRTDIHGKFPAVACDPLLHLVMSTAFSKVASDSDGELFQWISHGNWKAQLIELHEITIASLIESKEVKLKRNAEGLQNFSECSELLG